MRIFNYLHAGPPAPWAAVSRRAFIMLMPQCTAAGGVISDDESPTVALNSSVYTLSSRDTSAALCVRCMQVTHDGNM